MRFTAEKLYALLPAVYRDRDAEHDFALRDLMGVIAEQAELLEENIEELYDDQFIETCAEWVAPYIGTLIGYRPLHGTTAGVISPRAEVANTIRHRRRLGTASVLAQLARDATGWPAAAMEYFRLSATTQRMNHVRPAHHFAPDLHDWRGLEHLGTAFDPFTRTIDVRSIERADGRYGLPNIGIHLWRLEAQPRGTREPLPATPAAAGDTQRFLFSPLGGPLPLFIDPEANRQSDFTNWLDVPAPISRRALAEDLKPAGPGLPPAPVLYGRGQGDIGSLLVLLDGIAVAPADTRGCNLSDDAGTWANLPPAGGKVAIDPVLGRLALPADDTRTPSVIFHQGFSAPMGGGEYDRPMAESDRVLTVPTPDHGTIQSALTDLTQSGGIVEIADNGVYAEALSIQPGPGVSITLRAAPGMFPHLALTAPLEIGGEANAAVLLQGLLISREPITVQGNSKLARLSIRHCTLVPGLTLDAGGNPTQPGATSLLVACEGTAVEIEATIIGGLRLDHSCPTRITDSIVDAAAPLTLNSASAVAYAAPDDKSFGGPLTVLRSTMFGKIATERFDLVSSSLLVAKLSEGDTWQAPVVTERRQVGCMRFSFVPEGSIVPRRFRCQPQLAIDEALAARALALGAPVGTAERNAIRERERQRIVVSFAAQRYGRPAYGQLRASVPAEIRAGGEDESEMGAFHGLYAPQRESNLRIRLEEYLRFSLEAGAFLES